MRGRDGASTRRKKRFGLGLRFLLLLLLFSLYMMFETYIATWPVISGVVPDNLMEQTKSQIVFRSICFGFPLLFVIAAFSIVFSQRIAAPVSRLEHTLEKLVQGENPELLSLKREDELRQLANRINELVLVLREKKILGKEDSA